MTRRSVFVSLVAAVCVLASVAFAPRASAVRVLKPRFDDNSLNWAGYYVAAKPGQRITEVSGFTFAEKYRVAPPTLAASWVGIGGANTQDLIQAGVAFGQLEGYYAWFERLPEPMQPIRSGCAGDPRCTVVQGDRIDMNIRFLGGNTWRMTLVNVGKWSWSMDTPYDSSFSSAEWIYEAPSYFGAVYTIPANVPHAQFHRNRYVVNGQERTLRQHEATRTIFGLGRAKISAVSDVRRDSGFQVCPYKLNCPKP